MPHVINCTDAVGRLEGTIEDSEVLISEMRRAFDGLMLFNVLDNVLNLLYVIPQTLKRPSHCVIDDLQESAANQLLVFDQSDIRLHSRGVAIHHESNRAS